MKRSLFAILVPVVLVGAMLTAAPMARATIIHLHADLLGSNEIPPNVSPGTGFSDVDLDTVAQTLHIHTVFSGLLAPNTASHIHCCLSTPFASANVGVATTTPTFTDFPSGVTLGSYDHVFDLTDIDTYNHSSPTAFFATHGATVPTAEAALIAGLEAGETYLNIHTTAFPGGEIRGFLVPAVVPEPGTLGLLALGLGAGWVALRRKRA